jgi:hypothetical protein
MPKQEREIIIVGDDNQWYATLTSEDITDKNIQDEIDEINKTNGGDGFNELYVYDAIDITNRFNQ